MSTAIAILLGLVLLAFTWTSVLLTLVLPRAVGTGQALGLGQPATRQALMAVARLAKTYERKDSVLALIGPIAVLGQLVMWLVLIGTSFVIMLVPYTHNVATAITQVGEAMFTLGQARSSSMTNDTIVIFAAASGFVVIALQIAYLPSLYAAFNRRESLIAMLASRAGEPSWGPEILIRHQLVGIVDTLPDFYASWEQWAAEFSESHSSYPVLLLFRSPDPWSSWILALLSVLDAAAMQLALNPSTTPSQARLCLRMGYTRSARLRRARLEVRRRSTTRRSPSAHRRRVRVGGRAAARQRLRHRARRRRRVAALPRWRVNYEDLAYRWADRVLAPPGPWSGTPAGLPQQAVRPNRPPHRSPDDRPTYERPEF